MAIGVFGLRQVYKKQYQNVKSNNFASWPESATYGYYGSGSVNTISRLDFSSETVTDPGKNLGAARGNMRGVSSSSYGYFGGGYQPGPSYFSTTLRLDFSNENLTTPANNLPLGASRIGGTSTNSYGYFIGGQTSPPGTTNTTVSRLDFSSETISVPGKNLPTGRYAFAVCSNNFYGYLVGGILNPPPATVNTVTRFDFSNETTTDTGKNLLVLITPDGSLQTTAATSNNLYGYVGAAAHPSVGATCRITRIDFSNEIVSNPSMGLGIPADKNAATQNLSYGYFGGGNAPKANLCNIYRLDFATELVNTPGKNFSTARTDMSAVSGGASVYRGSKTYGYFGGGTNSGPFTNPPTSFSTILRLDFSSETVSDPGNNFPSNRCRLGAVSSNSYGYIVGNGSNTVIRLDFSTENVSLPVNTISPSRWDCSAVSSNSYGYFGGGYAFPGNPPYLYSTVTRLDFSNETISDPGKTLPSERRRMGTTSSNSYGYFGGGDGFTNLISRIDFTNETVSNPGKNLPTSNMTSSGTSSSFYGYFGGGFLTPINGTNYISTISRLDFSSETVSDPGNNLPSARSRMAAVSNSN